MRVLIICRLHQGQPSPFVRDQARSLASHGVQAEFLPLSGPGVLPYALHPLRLARRVSRGGVQLVHAYYGFSGMTALFERRVPLVMSFLGCDFNTWLPRFLAKHTVCRTAAKCLFMNQDMHALSGFPPASEVLPFGIDLQRFHPCGQSEAKKRLGLDPDKRYALFASTFDRPEKDPQLAFRAVALLHDPAFELLEFKTSYPPQAVNDLYNACDVLLLSSKREGSPQVVKEAMACGLPVVSTPVGDVPWLFGDTPGCFLTPPEPQALATALQSALAAERQARGRERLIALGLDLDATAARLAGIYRSVVEDFSRRV